MHSRKPSKTRSSLAAIALALTAVSAAQAQYCYVFSNSASGITVSAHINITSQTINNLTPGQTRFIQFSYTGDYTETIGNLTLAGSGPGVNATIGYEGVPGTVPWTAVVFGSGSTPNSTAGMAGMYWAVSLNGTGDLLPNGLTPTLGPVSDWQYDPGFGTPPGNHITIQPNGVSVKQSYDVIIDSITNCAGGGATISEKDLGDSTDVPGCVACGQPINLGNGNMYERAGDYQTVGLNPLRFTRYYNSMADPKSYATTLGANWRSNFDRYLRIGSATSVIAERADGQELTFTSTNGVWSTDTDVDVKLTNSGNTWTLTDRDDTVETYAVSDGASEGLLQTIQARNGYTQTLSYTGNQLTTVTDSFNRQLSFAYSNGLLQTVTTPDEVLTYGYTGNQLTSISYPTSPVASKTYVYENSAFPNALTGVIDENGNRFQTWTYDSTGRATSSQHAGGADLIQVAYNDTDGSRTVTNPLGEQELYKFTTLQGIPKATEIDRLTTAGVVAATRTFTYDSNGYSASQTDWNGNTTNYVNDVHGQPTSIVEAAGTSQSRTTTIKYHPSFHLPVKNVAPGLTTSFTYDNQGELLTATMLDTTTTKTPYSTAGQSRTWTYTWSNFELASLQTPRTDVSAVTSFTYDASGALTGITNALGQTAQITQFLPGGLPQTIVDANGVVTSLAYDPRLRLLSSTVSTAAGPMTTSYSYDAAEELVNVTLPDGSAFTNTYDPAHRLTGVADLYSQAAAYALDPMGNRTQINLTDSGGNLQRTHSSTFDALGRLLQDTAGAGQTTGYAYDGNGNRTAITDPLGNVTGQTFDALNRIVSVKDPTQSIAKSTYDAFDRPLSLTDPNGGVTTFVYDGFGYVIQRVSPDSGTTVFHYDSGGNLAQRIDGAGAITNFTRDALNRVVTVNYPADAAENITITYDQGNFGIGRLTGVTDAVGTLARTYDERANLLSETRVNNGVTLTTSYTYDSANRLASVTYPSGWAVSYARDAMGRPTTVSAQAPGGGAVTQVASNIGYQPFGPINALTFGNGISETSSFDLDYRQSSLSDAGNAAIQNLTYAYDAANNVTSITDGITQGNSQNFGYDVLNRLTAATGAFGTLGYSYDTVGNRLTQSFGDSSAATSYGYTAKSNQLSSVTDNGVAQAIAYAKNGNINSFSTTGATYNQAARLATVTAGNGIAAQYTYDAFGHRLARQGAVSGTTLYQYDPSGRLLEETDGAGNPLVDYIYLREQPVATISPSSNQIYFLHDDRLGTPQVATDSDQNVVWSANYGPFGEMTSVPAGIVQDLRLPGQEFDVETGLYHNGFRDYVPGWGRYLQSDPTGLAGGLNTYGYAGANPIARIDPLGLLDTQDIKNAWSGLEDTVSQDFSNVESAAKVQWDDLQAMGPTQYIKQFPCVRAAEKAFNAAVKAYEAVAPIKEFYDFFNDLASLGEDFAGAFPNVVSTLFKYGSANGNSWGTYCNPTDCPPFGNGTPPPPSK